MNALPKPGEFIDIGADVAGIRETLARRRWLVIAGLALRGGRRLHRLRWCSATIR